MSRGGRGSGRNVTPEEADLWAEITRTVDKARKKPRVGSYQESAPLSPAPSKPRPEPKTSAASKAKPAPPPAPAKPVRPAIPLAEFDRRAARQVASGRTAIDARLDLHGQRLKEARANLRAFLLACQNRGARTVLVITGKGAGAAEHDNLAGALGEPQRGVLRRSVPQWLSEPELRAVVLSFTTAGTRHGGEGALYVQLRKGGRES
jgi:DNA-nicking Smr family endonuclease